MSAPRVVGVGNALVDRTYTLSNLPSPDGGAYVLASSERFGGVETNVAAILDGFGHDAGVIARLGEDEDGRAVREHLERIGLDAARVRHRAGDTTAYTLVLRDRAGERMIIGGGNSTDRLTLTDADRAYLEDATVAFTSAYAPAPVLTALAEADVQAVFDLAGAFADVEHRGHTRRRLDRALPDLALFVGSADAVRSYLERDGPPRELAAGLRARGCPRGAVTAGTDGAVVFEADRTVAVPAIDVETVDTTGAGDAFTAGLVHAWLLGDRTPETAGRFAAVAAALNCTVEGAHADPPTVAEIEARLARE